MDKCKDCYNMECIFISETNGCDAVETCDDFKPMTNRDRLRAMTDEELAKFFYDTDIAIPWCDECRSHHEQPNGCEKCMVDWLKEEAE